MNERDIIKKYAYYYDWLEKLGSIPLTRKPVQKDIEPSRGVTQAVYKQIKEERFKGDLIDYLCWISAKHIEILARNTNMTIAQFVEVSYESLKSDCNNLFRIIFKNPRAITIEKDDFLKLAEIWFKNATR